MLANKEHYSWLRLLTCLLLFVIVVIVIIIIIIIVLLLLMLLLLVLLFLPFQIILLNCMSCVMFNVSCIMYHVSCIMLLQLIPMTDIQEVSPDFQKMNKTENCIVLYMKNDTKIAITSPVSSGLSIIFIHLPPAFWLFPHIVFIITIIIIVMLIIIITVIVQLNS